MNYYNDDLQTINNILYSCHIIIMAKGTMDNYPFYTFEEGKWLIHAIKLNIDRDWNKEMKGLVIYKEDNVVFSKGYRAWVGRNYLPVCDVYTPGDWVNELSILRDKLVNKLRMEEIELNNRILKELSNINE